MTPQRDHAGESLEPIGDLWPEWSEDGKTATLEVAGGVWLTVVIHKGRIGVRLHDRAGAGILGSVAMNERTVRAVHLLFASAWCRLADPGQRDE